MKQFLFGVSILGVVVGGGYLGVTQFYKGFGPMGPPQVEPYAAPEVKPIPLGSGEEPVATRDVEPVDPFAQRRDFGGGNQAPPSDASQEQPRDPYADARYNDRRGAADSSAGNAAGYGEPVVDRPAARDPAERRNPFGGDASLGDPAAEPGPVVAPVPVGVGVDLNAAPGSLQPPDGGGAPAGDGGANNLPNAATGYPSNPANNFAGSGAPSAAVGAVLAADPYARPMTSAEVAQGPADGPGNGLAGGQGSGGQAGDGLGGDLFAPIGSPGDQRVAPASATRIAGPLEGIGRPGDLQLEGSQTPALSIEKQSPGEIQVGKPAVFTIVVRNTGAVAAHGVEVHDDVPQGAQFMSSNPPATQPAPGKLVWSLGEMRPGDSATIQTQLMPVSEGEIGSVATVHFHAAASARARSTRPLLKLQVSTPPNVMIGQPVALKIRLSNPGTGVATGVVLTENVPAELKHAAGPELEFEVGSLRPGESRDLELTLTAAQAGHIVNLLTAQADNNLQTEDRAEFDVLAPALKLGVTGPKRRFLERNATFTVSITNPGTAPAHDVQLAATLPRGMKFVDANNMGQYDAATNTVYWSLEELPPQETGKVTVTAVPQQPGEMKLQARARAQQGLSDSIEETVSVDGMAAVVFEMSDAQDPIELNGQTTYQIHVINQGSKSAANVRVVALLPAELRPLSAEGPVKHAIDGQRVLFEPLGQLPPKADATFAIKVQAVAAGDIRVRVQVLSDDMRSPITKEEGTRVYADE